MRTVNVAQAQPDAARKVEANGRPSEVEANAWLAAFGDLLAMFRDAAGRPPNSQELALIFATLTETEIPPR